MTITLSQARQVVDASLAKGRELGLKPLSVVVLDTRGSLVAALSEDGCAQLRPKVAHGKANAAIGLGMGTRALMDRAEQQAYFVQAVNGVLGGDMVPVPGGVLIRTAVPANQVERRDWDVEFGLIGIFESQEFGGLSLCRNSLQTSISTHAMLKMHNGIIHV